MSYSSDPVHDAARYYDGLYDRQEEAEAEAEMHRAEFLEQTERDDFTGPCRLSAPAKRYTSGRGFIVRPETVAEFLVSTLESSYGHRGEPCPEEAITLICAAANGADIRDMARDFIKRLAAVYATSKVEE